MDTLDIQILRYISESRESVSFRRLHRHFKGSFQSESKSLKQAVRRLAQAGRLCYRTDFGTSYLDIAIDGPVKVSEHVFLKPPRIASVAGPGQLDVLLEKGAAFGRGDHPTTQLAIQLIDGLLHERPWQRKMRSVMALDIGTGSGVLAIAAAKMGVGRIQAVDIDPCAVFEARANIRLNGVEDQVVVIDNLQETGSGCCDLIVANLRTPTLMALLPRIVNMAATGSALIFSGMRAEETGRLRKRYRAAGFFERKICSEKGWCACLLVRGESQRHPTERISRY